MKSPTLNIRRWMLTIETLINALFVSEQPWRRVNFVQLVEGGKPPPIFLLHTFLRGAPINSAYYSESASRCTCLSSVVKWGLSACLVLSFSGPSDRSLSVAFRCEQSENRLLGGKKPKPTF